MLLEPSADDDDDDDDEEEEEEVVEVEEDTARNLQICVELPAKNLLRRPSRVATNLMVPAHRSMASVFFSTLILYSFIRSGVLVDHSIIITVIQ